MYYRAFAIFLGIKKVVARALEDNDDNNSSSVYPCSIQNRFECPYDNIKKRKKKQNQLMLTNYFNYQKLPL
jgi:hypothetical protein